MDADPEASVEMIVDCAVYEAGRRIRDIRLEEIRAALEQENEFVWLDLFEPDEKLMKQVQAQFGLHDLAVEDAHRAHQRPKLEIYGDSLFVVLHTAQFVKDKLRFGETYAFVGPRYMVTVRHGASLTYAPVRERCEAVPERLSKGPGYALYSIMDFVVDNYLPIVDRLEDQLATLEEAIFARGRKHRTTQELYAIKRSLTALRRVVMPLTEIFGQLSRAGHPIIHEDIQPYYRDVADHVIRIGERTELMREMLDAALLVNLSLLSVAQNDVVKKLAGWAALLAVPTLVASFYGMNFKHMPELEWAYSYPAVVAITAAVCILLYRKLKRAEWL